MAVHFLDSSALQHRYLQGPDSVRVRRLVSNRRILCFIAEWSMVEMASAMARRCRQGALTVKDFDSMSAAFIKDVADGRVQVRNMNKRDMRRARDLIRYAGMIRRRNLGSGDAIIATCCLDLALERREKLIFYTSDWGLFDTLRTINAFTSALTIQFLGVPRVAGVPTRTT